MTSDYFDLVQKYPETAETRLRLSVGTAYKETSFDIGNPVFKQPGYRPQQNSETYAQNMRIAGVEMNPLHEARIASQKRQQTAMAKTIFHARHYNPTNALGSAF